MTATGTMGVSADLQISSIFLCVGDSVIILWLPKGTDVGKYIGKRVTVHGELMQFEYCHKIIRVHQLEISK